MTDQIRNTYKYKNKDYSMVALSNPLPFKPQNYGITPSCCTRSCYDGYWCEYEISDERIILESFCVNSKEGYYPKINGIVPLYEETPKMFSALFKYLGHHYYKGVNIRVDYTGRLVAGSDFLLEYRIPYARPRAWEYQELKEFVFVDGRLTDVINHNGTADILRRRIKEEPNFMEKFRERKLIADEWWIYGGKYREAD